MAGDDAITDAERISIGRKPFQGEQLYDRDDLAVLERLGHEPGDHIPMVVWDSVNWSCPLDGCEGSLGLIDTRMRNLPTNPYALDDTVSVGKKTYISLTEAQSPSEPLVACHKCGKRSRPVSAACATPRSTASRNPASWKRTTPCTERPASTAPASAYNM